MGDGEDVGLRRVAASLDEVHRSCRPMASSPAWRSRRGRALRWAISSNTSRRSSSLCKCPDRLGVCLDTAHLFAAGYDFRGRKYAKFRKQLEATVGVSEVKVLHLNDSKKGLGSRVDRHEHIGKGEIGLTGLSRSCGTRPFRKSRRSWRRRRRGKARRTGVGRSESGDAEITPLAADASWR